jgi:ABC-type multidrug transport system ATPase subunit
MTKSLKPLTPRIKWQGKRGVILRLMDTTVLIDAKLSKIETLSWENVTYALPPDKGGKEKVLLNGISGQVRAGQVVAILGGSGAGKTTLLNTLAGRIGPGRLEGNILVDGYERNAALWNIQCAYVEQDDIMFRNLSVFETLKYAAYLRLPSSMSNAMKLQRVESIINALGLQGWYIVLIKS